MIVVRDVYQAKYGKGGELVALLKEFRKLVGSDHPSRLLSDASGPFFTIVEEIEVASLAEWESISRRIFNSEEFAPWFARWLTLVESGHREFYNIEQ